MVIRHSCQTYSFVRGRGPVGHNRLAVGSHRLVTLFPFPLNDGELNPGKGRIESVEGDKGFGYPCPTAHPPLLLLAPGTVNRCPQLT